MVVPGFDVVYTDLTDVPGTGFCFAELTEVFGTGIDVVLKLPKCPVPVIPAVCLGAYRTKHTLSKECSL